MSSPVDGANRLSHDETEIDLLQLWQALMRRKWIIIGLMILSGVMAYVASDMMTPIYRAETTLLVNSSSGTGLSGLLPEGFGGSSNTQLQRATEILRSRSLALEAAHALGYDWDESSAELRQFRNSISIQSNASSDLLTISVEHEDRQEAQRIANTFADSFIDMMRAINTGDIREARAFIGEQLEVFKTNLTAAEEALLDYEQMMGISIPLEGVESGERVIESEVVVGSAVIMEDLLALERSRAETWVNIQTAEQHLAMLQGDMLDERRAVTSERAISGDPTVQNLRTSLIRLEMELAGALEQYTERHPTVMTLRAQIDELQAEMASTIGQLQESHTDIALSHDVLGLQAELYSLYARMEALDTLIAQKEVSLVGLPERELQLRRHMRDAAVTETIYTTLLRRYEEMRISEAMEAASAKVLDRAILPVSPVKPRKNLNIAIAVFLGAFVGVSLAILIEYTDKSFRSVEDIEATLGLPVIGRIPTFKEAPEKRRKAG